MAEFQYFLKCNRLLAHPNVSLIFWMFDIMTITYAITFLVLPYWFYQAGLFMGISMLSVCFALSIVASLWILEALGRMNALYRQEQGYISLDGKYEISEVSINPERKFELNEILSFTVGKTANCIFTLGNIIGCLIMQFYTVVIIAQSLSTTLPINTTTFRTCNSSEFDTNWVPVGRCLNWYRIMVGGFGFFATALHFLRKKNQKYIMAAISLFRIFVILYMTCFSIFIIQKESGNNQTKYEHHFVERFSFRSGILAFASFSGMIFMPTMMPFASHNVMNKKLLRPVMVASLLLSLFLLTAYSICLALAFESNIHPNVVLNMQTFTMDKHIFIQIMSYLMIIFPIFDASSGFACTVTFLSNITFTLLIGKDYTAYSRTWHWKLLNFFINFTYCSLSWVVCMFISNVAFITSLAGVFICICSVTFTGLIQFSTNRKCNIFIESAVNKSKIKQFWGFLFKTSFPTPNTTIFSNNMVVFLIVFSSIVMSMLSFYFIIVSYI